MDIYILNQFFECGIVLVYIVIYYLHLFVFILAFIFSEVLWVRCLGRTSLLRVSEPTVKVFSRAEFSAGDSPLEISTSCLAFFLINYFIEGLLLYRILLFSVKPQHESAIGIDISPPF